MDRINGGEAFDMKNSSRALSLIAILTLSAAVVASQEKSASELATEWGNNIPPSSIEIAEKNGTAYLVSLRDLTKLALQNNLDIAISDTNEELYKSKLLQAYGPYDPAIALTLSAQSMTQPNTNLVNESTAGTSNNTKQDVWNFQFTQNVPTGGSITASLNSNRLDTNQLFSLINPQYTATSSLQFTQPLLRNRQIDQNRGTIKVANLDIKINDSQFRQTITNTIASIQSSYWDLAYAIGNYDITRQSVKLAQATVDENRTKVRIGVASPIDITTAQATLASRMVDLVAAQQAINVAENNLRSTISSNWKSDIWKNMIVPTDRTDFVEHKVDMSTAIATALDKRPELEQYNLQMQENDINYAVDKNQKKWQLNAVAAFGTVGVAGPQSYVNGVPIIDPSMVGGAGTAYQDLLTKGFETWSVGFNVQIPLRNRTLDGQLGQLKVQKKQLLMNEKSQEQKIAVAIRNAVDDLGNNKQRVETATVARELAQIQLDAETKRFKAGTSSNFLLLQRQTDLATAQGAELQALVNYKKAVITLEQNMFTLLEAGDFEVVGAAAAKSK
jgi:HAE1 family hydrophobic/amphiphilic exporter-1